MNKKILGDAKKQVRGITLIALVITIIVLLILAGVTINLTLGENGIFRTAEQAGKNYTQAQEQELAGLAGFENEINNIIGGMNTPTTNYDTVASKAKPGDYVRYTPANKTFSATPEQTGQDTNQDFNTGDYTGLWRVLYNDEEHGLQIISEGSVGNLALGHEDSDGDPLTITEEDEEKVIRAYNNSISTLNSFCRNYVDTRYAITGRSVGSDPVNPDVLSEMENLLLSGYEDKEVYKTDGNLNTDLLAMYAPLEQIHNIGVDYWLASRLLGNQQDGALLMVYYMGSNGQVMSNNNFLWQCTDSGLSMPKSYTRGVRPVITLKNGIQTNIGDGSEDLPFELVAM